MLLIRWYSIHCPLEMEVWVVAMENRSSFDFVHSCDSRCTKAINHFSKNSVKFLLPAFLCCGDVFAFLSGGELLYLGCAFLFVAFFHALDCSWNEFWEGRPRAYFVRLRTAVLILCSSRTSWATWTLVCKAFSPITLAPCWRWGIALRNRPLNMDPSP